MAVYVLSRSFVIAKMTELLQACPMHLHYIGKTVKVYINYCALPDRYRHTLFGKKLGTYAG